MASSCDRLYQPLTPPRVVKKISSIVPVVLCQWATFHKAVDARARKHRAPNMNKCHYVCVTYVLLYREILRLPCAGAISKFEAATTSKGKIDSHHTRFALLWTDPVDTSLHSKSKLSRERTFDDILHRPPLLFRLHSQNSGWTCFDVLYAFESGSGEYLGVSQKESRMTSYLSFLQ